MNNIIKHSLVFNVNFYSCVIANYDTEVEVGVTDKYKTGHLLQ